MQYAVCNLSVDIMQLVLVHVRTLDLLQGFGVVGREMRASGAAFWS